MSEKKSTRRSFLNFVLGGSGLAVTSSIIYPLVAFIQAPEKSESDHNNTILEEKFGDIQPGDWSIFRFGNKPGIWIMRETDGQKELLAYSATCTHLNCIVEFVPEDNTLFCPCHKGSFDINGNNISGPPPSPLEKFTVLVKEDDSIEIFKGA
jgi:Rieske Fe-S protein